ncbi:AraC family transcriptional regulator [Arenibacter aquaticus]|uniref:AraC family transcriptional regulator n=1 Tax=Arenibacter aquaticus TaxID=2489054 RepID=A0A430JZT3_9FLAO|nr:helix-turn-helix transcriptional regulator [Arenibacter aquaticus]RTE52323.1 AraC family transcriptional regulator [Arenibacter aquaticus]
MKKIPTLSITQFEKQEQLDDFYSNNLETHLNKNREYFHKPHRHNFFLCALFTKGSGIHEIDFETYNVKPGSIFFLRPGQTHFWKFTSAPDGYIFFHTQEFFELHFTHATLNQFPFYYSLKNPPRVQIAMDKLKEIELKFREINQEYYVSLPFKRQKIASLLNTVYIDLSRPYIDIDQKKEVVSIRYLDTIRALEKLISLHYKTQKSAKFYADSLHISSKHLNRIVRTTLNKTTTQLITEHIILEAKRLLVHSNNTLSEIARIMGYEDYAHFSKVFKTTTRISPKGFKKNYT